MDITRQSLQLLFDGIYKQVVRAFKLTNKHDFAYLSELMLNILDDLNAILSTNKYFLLGNWIESAKSLANDDQVVFNLNY